MAIVKVRERRDPSPAGQSYRAQFEASNRTLRTLGLSAKAIDYCRRRARLTRRLPHEVAAEFVEGAILQISVMETIKDISGGV
jgi:hypothetical protein